MELSFEKRLSRIFMSMSDLLCEGFGEAVNALRGEYFSTFMLGGVPSASSEGWRHTPLNTRFADADYELYFVRQTLPAEFGPLPEPSALHVVMENGFCSTECASTTDGVVYGSLRGALDAWPMPALKYYNSAADNARHALTALSSALMQDGAFVYVPDGVSATVVIDERYASHEAAQMCQARTLIVLGDGARASVAHVRRSGSPQTRFLINGVRETVLGRGACLDFTELDMLCPQDSLVQSSYLVQQAASRSEYLLFEAGAGLARYNLHTGLEASGASARLGALYMVGEGQHADLAVDVCHNAPQCSSEQTIKGIASQTGVGVFSGLVRVAEGAQFSDASQSSRGLLLGPDARILAEPQLEIYADDVKCSHGSAVGQLDDRAVYYMRQRGLSEAQARMLQLEGFAADITGRCRMEGIGRLFRAKASAEIEKLQ